MKIYQSFTQALPFVFILAIHKTIAKHNAKGTVGYRLQKQKCTKWGINTGSALVKGMVKTWSNHGHPLVTMKKPWTNMVGE